MSQSAGPPVEVTAGSKGEWIVHLSDGPVRTHLPPKLIHALAKAKGPAMLGYELERAGNKGPVMRMLSTGLGAYATAADLQGKRVLDFGCGTGTSTVAMALTYPEASFVGVELEERWVEAARVRAEVFSAANAEFAVSPNGASLPDVGRFDFVMLSAVWEHLLPGERPGIARALWDSLRPGGIIFLNQTPHRWWPLESHTTGLPLINYLPKGLAHRYAKLSPRLRGDESWSELLRYGVRGGTVREILGMFSSPDAPATLAAPREDVGDRLDLWLDTSSGLRMPWAKRATWAGLKAVKALTGRQVAPVLTIAIQKQS
ncbi:MAG: class I SAM-dependent methyltransferase [Proteobacteria bacterium]|nr:class I SAM-dependent methyltransferase [Pseudomonadota bacterium]